MSDVIQLVANDWVTEVKLIALTGLRPGTIMRARKQSWFMGREYRHVSPDGVPKPTSECLYHLPSINRWIENQEQPGAKKA